MDLNDAERYAVAALFTLALHSTHVETGIDKHGNSLSESDIAWGCPSEELFDEQLLSQVPLKLPPDLLDIFWGFDCMAPAGLAPRLYAWLKVPRKAWPGLLRMPDLAGNAGSPEAVEAFVALVRRYSAFLDPELDFTTGQASRLQQHFSLSAATSQAEQQQQQQQREQQQEQQQAASDAAGSSTAATSQEGSSLGRRGLVQRTRSSDDDAMSSCSSGMMSRQGATPTNAVVQSTSMPADEAVAAAAASITAAAIAAERTPAAVAGSSGSSLSAVGAVKGGSVGQEEEASAFATAAEADMRNINSSSSSTAAGTSAGSQARLQRASSSAADAFVELHESVDMMPRAADEGTVVPAATFTPAEQYSHSTSHKAVLALYEVIGGCLACNTEADMEPLFAMAAREAEFGGVAAAAKDAKKKQQQQQRANSTDSSSSSSQQQQQEGSSPGSGDAERPSGAWFPAGGDGDVDDSSKAASTGSSSSKPAAESAASGKQQQEKQQEQLSLEQRQQQQQQGLALVQLYDARARVAVKRVAHWLRVPWPQVRAFEQMWAAQALNLDPATAQPKYANTSRAMQYLKVGAAAVGGGALLAVTGGLAAPAIAAGLGAAVTLAHGGAAAAAAVAGFAGSTAGTAAVTGLFGAWGASVGGGSAGQLYGEVKEFGFWDLSQSIYTDGKGPAEKAKEAEEAAAGRASKPEEAAAEANSAASGELGGAGQAAAASLQKQQQTGQAAGVGAAAAAAAEASSSVGQPQEQQQSGFLHRLFSPNPGAGNNSSNASKQKQDQEMAAAAEAAAAAAEPDRSQAASSSVAAPSTAPGSSATGSQSPAAPQQPQQHVPKSPRNIFGWGSKTVDDDNYEDGPAPQPRPKGIRLNDSAFNADSDEDEQQFYQKYLNTQQQPAATPRSGASSSTPRSGQGSIAPKQQLGGSGPLTEQQKQQPQQHSGNQQQQRGLVLQAVEANTDPLSCKSPAAAEAAVAAVPEQQDMQAPLQQAQQQLKQPGTEQLEDQPQDQDGKCNRQDNKSPANDAAAPAATSTASPPAAAAAQPTTPSGSSSPAAVPGGVLGGLFSRKPPPPPVYVPLLPTPVNPKHRAETRMALTIAVNGCCIESMEDYVRPWKQLPSRDCDRFALVWESACLKELGRAVVGFLAQQALQQVAQKSLQTFLYTGLVGALALPMTLSTAIKVAFGSKWLVALRRAQAAGKMLAVQLAQGCHGGRPVTLIGCSMGARLVFHCCLELARLGAKGCVENVILLGSPLSCRPDRWCVVRSVVAGRLINGYSVNDWTMGLLYRVHSSSSIWLQAAGMYKVEVPGVENINLSRLISGHQDYLEAMDEILEVINLHDS